MTLPANSPPVMLITGASRGIGAATALLAAQQGYAVCVNYLHQQQAAQALVERIHAQGGLAIAVCADIAHIDQIDELFKQCDQKLGPISVLVNNAGILAQQMDLVEMTADRIAAIFNCNVIGTMLCSQQAIKRMSTRFGGKGGSIINVSSVAARLGAAHQYVDYAASKGAIDTFTFGLAQEVAAQGIRVNAVAPGIIDTDIHASGGDPQRIARIAASLPMARAGSANEVAQAILWLCSDAASYVNGSILDVAGAR